jgi:hypothetical protein
MVKNKTKNIKEYQREYYLKTKIFYRMSREYYFKIEKYIKNIKESIILKNRDKIILSRIEYYRNKLK